MSPTTDGKYYISHKNEQVYYIISICNKIPFFSSKHLHHVDTVWCNGSMMILFAAGGSMLILFATIVNQMLWLIRDCLNVMSRFTWQNWKSYFPLFLSS